MADESLTYLASLPKPSLIQELDYETINAERLGVLVDKFDAVGVAYDVANLETDGAVINVEEAADRETLLRGDMNDVARGRYRLFAVGADLDHLAEFYYGVRRMTGESDERLNERITLAQQGVSVAGPEAYFQRLAMAADIRVANVRVWRHATLPILNISVLSTDAGGVADDDLLATVRAAVTGDAVRPTSAANIVVASAVRSLTDVVARMTLLPGTSETILDDLRDGMPAAWAKVGTQGRDLTDSWIAGYLMVSGVYKVEVQTGPRQAGDHEMVRIGAVSLPVIGRAY